jgi:hypothetical protein
LAARGRRGRRAGEGAIGAVRGTGERRFCQRLNVISNLSVKKRFSARFFSARGALVENAQNRRPFARSAASVVTWTIVRFARGNFRTTIKKQSSTNFDFQKENSTTL